MNMLLTPCVLWGFHTFHVYSSLALFLSSLWQTKKGNRITTRFWHSHHATRRQTKRQTIRHRFKQPAARSHRLCGLSGWVIGGGSVRSVMVVVAANCQYCLHGSLLDFSLLGFVLCWFPLVILFWLLLLGTFDTGSLENCVCCGGLLPSPGERWHLVCFGP